MTIEFFPEDYGQVGGAPPAPGIVPNGVPGGHSPADLAAAGLGLAGNAGVPGDIASSTEADLDRRARAAEAAAKFPANEADAASQMEGVGGQGMAQMVPQLISGLAGAVTGAIGGVMGPLTQMPQQAMQAGQSALQPLMSAMKGSEGLEAGLADGTGGAALADSVGQGESGLGGGGGGLGGGATTPTGFLGPPPVPTSSPPTTPAAASAKSVAATPTGGTPMSTTQSGMTGMPMMPPGAMGHGSGDGSKDKPGEKRVTVPGVPNGQPVKGRLTAPPSVPVTKSADGKPAVVARPNRRIVIMPPEDEAKE
jgi:hypothetical protein